MTKKKNNNFEIPITSDQLLILQKLTTNFSSKQFIWLSGYFCAKADEINKHQLNISDKNKLKEDLSLTITLISASQTGNAHKLSEEIYNNIKSLNINIKLVYARDYKCKQIIQEKILLIITSTQGLGEPPDEAIELYSFLMSEKAPILSNLYFAIFGLGDSSYEFFNKVAKDLDNRLHDLGAIRLLKRVDADVQYESQAKHWNKDIIQSLNKSILNKNLFNKSPDIYTNITNNKNQNTNFSKNNPFIALLNINQKITSRNSAQDVHHIEINLGNSGLQYQPGDVLGIWYENDPKLVKELIKILGWKSKDIILFNNYKNELKKILQNKFEITTNTPKIIKQYANLSKNNYLLNIIKNENFIKEYAKNIPIIEMIRQVPLRIDPNTFLSMLVPLRPRFYSISSSLLEHPNELHITVGLVRYKIKENIYEGGASSYLCNRVNINNKIKIFIQNNSNFRLPINIDTPIIMISTGTGIAPFRAFIQHRSHENKNSKNWLFFGNPHLVDDFLYQLEWQKYFHQGLITDIDLSWSRDQKHKIYVQDNILLKGKKLWQWIEDGAHIYICGNANHMAKEVENALLNIISKHGKMNYENSQKFLNKLRFNRRYQRDIY